MELAPMEKAGSTLTVRLFPGTQLSFPSEETKQALNSKTPTSRSGNEAINRPAPCSTIFTSSQADWRGEMPFSTSSMIPRRRAWMDAKLVLTKACPESEQASSWISSRSPAYLINREPASGVWCIIFCIIKISGNNPTVTMSSDNNDYCNQTRIFCKRNRYTFSAVLEKHLFF